MKSLYCTTCIRSHVTYDSYDYSIAHHQLVHINSTGSGIIFWEEGARRRSFVPRCSKFKALLSYSSTVVLPKGEGNNMKPIESSFVYMLLALGGQIQVLHGHENMDHKGDGSHKCGTPEPTDADRFAQKSALSIYKGRPVSSRAPSRTVPTCFHVLSTSSGVGNLTDAQLQAQLDALNTAFGSGSCCDTDLSWCKDNCSVDTGFDFGMAVLDGGRNVIDGSVTYNVSDSVACVTRTTNNLWAGDGDEHAMKSALRKGDKKVLNVYFVNFADGLLGYAYLPWQVNVPVLDGIPVLDGVVNHYDSIPGGGYGVYDEGDTLVHEVGHWLGLLHTFQGGCSISDGVADTAPEQSPNYGGCSSPGSRDTCPGDGPDPVFNFMDYSNDECMYEFTVGQRLVMEAVWDIYRLGNDAERAEIVLTQGESSDPLYLGPEERQVYKIDISSIAGDITCAISGREGNADLYMSLDSTPRFNRRDCCVSRSSGSNESCDRVIPEKLFDYLPFSLLASSGSRCLDCGARARTLYAGVVASGIQAVQDLTITCG
jgi:hypothetical protein